MLLLEVRELGGRGRRLRGVFYDPSHHSFLFSSFPSHPTASLLVPALAAAMLLALWQNGDVKGGRGGCTGGYSQR